MNYIRRLIGQWTKPMFLFEYYDQYYSYCDEHYASGRNHNYQRVSQGYWGVWEYRTEWIGLNRPLQRLEND